MVAQSKIRACDEVVCVLHAACFFVQHCGWRVFKACMLACMRMVQRVYIVLSCHCTSCVHQQFSSGDCPDAAWCRSVDSDLQRDMQCCIAACWCSE
jgi:hypothetical protein